MTENILMEIIKQTIFTAMKLAAPLLLTAMVVGIVISIIQATTQIQEQTLTFVPKLIVSAVMGLIFGKWMLHTLISFFNNIMEIMVNTMK